MADRRYSREETVQVLAKDPDKVEWSGLYAPDGRKLVRKPEPIGFKRTADTPEQESE